MLLGIPYNQFKVRNQEYLYRGHESLLQSWPDLSDPTVYPISFNTLMSKISKQYVSPILLLNSGMEDME